MTRDDADFVRPRLFTADDPRREDDVGLVLEALDGLLSERMAEGSRESVEHITRLRRRIADAGGEGYDGPDEERGGG